MCRNCGDYSSDLHTDLLQTTLLTWAVPVDAVELGASLEAYLEAKPFITQLLLCHRFGRGSNVLITKLPREIVDLVAEVLIAGHRTSQQERWGQMQKCSLGRCTGVDHWESWELDFVIGMAEKELACNPDCLRVNETKQDYIDEHIKTTVSVTVYQD